VSVALRSETKIGDNRNFTAPSCTLQQRHHQRELPTSGNCPHLLIRLVQHDDATTPLQQTTFATLHGGSSCPAQRLPSQAQPNRSRKPQIFSMAEDTHTASSKGYVQPIITAQQYHSEANLNRRLSPQQQSSQLNHPAART